MMIIIVIILIMIMMVMMIVINNEIAPKKIVERGRRGSNISKRLEFNDRQSNVFPTK